jgi:hypothetical protein
MKEFSKYLFKSPLSVFLSSLSHFFFLYFHACFRVKGERNILKEAWF